MSWMLNSLHPCIFICLVHSYVLSSSLPRLLSSIVFFCDCFICSCGNGHGCILRISQFSVCVYKPCLTVILGTNKSTCLTTLRPCCHICFTGAVNEARTQSEEMQVQPSSESAVV